MSELDLLRQVAQNPRELVDQLQAFYETNKEAICKANPDAQEYYQFLRGSVIPLFDRLPDELKDQLEVPPIPVAPAPTPESTPVDLKPVLERLDVLVKRRSPATPTKKLSEIQRDLQEIKKKSEISDDLLELFNKILESVSEIKEISGINVDVIRDMVNAQVQFGRLSVVLKEVLTPDLDYRAGSFRRSLEEGSFVPPDFIDRTRNLIWLASVWSEGLQGEEKEALDKLLVEIQGAISELSEKGLIRYPSNRRSRPEPQPQMSAGPEKPATPLNPEVEAVVEPPEAPVDPEQTIGSRVRTTKARSAKAKPEEKQEKEPEKPAPDEDENSDPEKQLEGFLKKVEVSEGKPGEAE